MVVNMTESLCAVYDFRANENLYSVDSLRDWLTANCKKWTFQKEKGDSGYVHWQGRFSLIKKRQKHLLLKMFETIPAPNYLEPTTSAEHKKESFYCQKEDTRIEGPWKDTDTLDEQYIPRQYRGITLYPFQKQILESANVFEPRIINLIYDKSGCSGKSTIASICELMHGGVDMPPLNDYKELIALACNICMDGNIRNPKIMFFDMPRAVNKTQLNGLFSAIEQIKKGKLYDCRYHYKKWWIDSPQIWVFTNSYPDIDMLSLDRWKIWQISSDKKLEPYSSDDQENNPLDQGYLE